MTDNLCLEYYILSFVPSVLSDESAPIGILLREIETVSAETRLRFARAKFVQELELLPVVGLEADETLIREAITEIRAVLKRTNANGQHDELEALLQELLNANSGLCARGPHPCRATSNPELELQALFERFTHRLS